MCSRISRRAVAPSRSRMAARIASCSSICTTSPSAGCSLTWKQVAGEGRLELADHLHEAVVARGLVDHAVGPNGPDIWMLKAVSSSAPWRPYGDAAAPSRSPPPARDRFRWWPARRRAPRHSSFELGAQVVGLAHLRARRDAHDRAAVGGHHHQPQRLQLAQRLADRRAADLEPLAQLPPQTRTGRQRPRDDRGLEAERDLVGEARGLERRVGQPRWLRCACAPQGLSGVIRARPCHPGLPGGQVASQWRAMSSRRMKTASGLDCTASMMLRSAAARLGWPVQRAARRWSSSARPARAPPRG